MLNSANQRVPTAKVVEDPSAVRKRLIELGAELEVIQGALWRAHAEHSMTTTHDPDWFVGGVLSAKTTRFLRDTLVPSGWTAVSDAGLAVTVHPSGYHCIVVWSGDARTGDARYTPSTRRPRGEASRLIVSENVQADLWGATPTRPLRNTWALLVRPDTAGVTAELSLPLSVTAHGEIDSWSERIILPHTACGETPTAAFEPVPPAPREGFDADSMAR